MARQHVSFRVEESVVERLRNAVHHNRGAPLFLTLDGYVEHIVEKAVERLEKAQNGGQPYGKPERRKASGR
jgi:hypothetical protein